MNYSDTIKKTKTLQETMHFADINNLEKCTDLGMLQKKNETYIMFIDVLKSKASTVKQSNAKFLSGQIAKYQELSQIAQRKIEEVKNGNHQ